MTRKTSRRALLRLGGTVSVFGASGCLRSVANQPENETEPSDERNQSSPTSAGESDTPAEGLTDAWQLELAGGDVVAADSTFVLASQDPVRLMAVDSNGNEIWQNEEIHASSRRGLGLSGDVLAVCGQNGEIAVVDRQSGETQWTFTETEYGNWQGPPMISDSYVAALNQGESTTEAQRVYVFDIESGTVVLAKDYETADGVGIAGQRAFVVTTNQLEIYDMAGASGVHRVSEFVGGPLASAGSRLYVGANLFVGAFDLSEDEPTNLWNTDIRGEPVALHATQDAIYVGGNGGVYAFNAGGERRWWGRTDGTPGRPAVGQETVFVTTDSGRLHAFDKASGDSVGTIELSNESAPRASVAAIGETAVVMGGTTRAFTRHAE